MTRCLIFLLLLCSPLAAQDKTLVDITGTQAGSYLLVIGADGSVTLNSCKVLSPNGPAPPPTPDVLTERGKQIQAAMASVNDPNKATRAAQLSTLYRGVQKQVAAGTLSGQATIATVISKTQEIVLGADKAKYQPVLDQVGKHWDAMVQAGANDVAYAAYLGEAANGIEAAVPQISKSQQLSAQAAAVVSLRDVAGDQKLDPEVLKAIIELILYILQILLPQA